MAKDLKRRGWTFVGPTTVYAFMQAMGLVNDHLEGCPVRAAAAARGAAGDGVIRGARRSRAARRSDDHRNPRRRRPASHAHVDIDDAAAVAAGPRRSASPTRR